MGFWDSVKRALIGDPIDVEQKPAPPASEVESKKEEEKPSKPADSPPKLPEGEYRRVKIERGPNGWGGPLIVAPKAGKDLIYCVTGGGIHPVAQKIADLTGGKPLNGFRTKADFDEIAVAVIDCGGTARVGVYPMKNVLTVDIHDASPSGPLIKFITEDLFVSGVSEANITLVDE